MGPEIVSIRREAYWSDLFFNWEGHDLSAEDGLKERAKEFLDEHPSCPYDASWFVQDYRNRL